MQFYIETERLILRNLQDLDVNGMLELNSDPEVQKYVGNKPIGTLEQAAADLDFIKQQYIANGIGRWAVIEKNSGLFMGWAGLKLIREEMNGHCDFYELGYRLISKYWGKGFATEAAIASIKYGFNELNLAVIYAITDVGNTASKHVLEKIGFQFIEIFEYQGLPHNWLALSRS